MNQLKSDHPALETQLAWLYGRINYERRARVTPRSFKLDGMRAFLEKLGSPHRNYPIVHVAGTKGKGSVSTMIGNILRVSGRRTGVYTSPHLEAINQRMAINDQPISDHDFAETLLTLRPVVEEMDQAAESRGHRPLTFFEITTAAAFCYFANQNCDAAVFEVGLGGRLDSTNVCQPDCSVITNVSIDHTRQLGSTVDKIAFEKAGIIKPNVPVVSGAMDPDAAEVIRRIAQERQAPLVEFGKEFTLVEKEQRDEFSVHGNFIENVKEPSATKIGFCVDPLRLTMIGAHQKWNAAIAVATVQVLNQLGWGVADEAIRTGLAETSLPGRTEVVHRSPTVVLDVAHNVASIEVLLRTLQNQFPPKPTGSTRKLICAFSKDKDIEGMLQRLLPAFDEIIVTRYLENPRGKPVSDVLSLAQRLIDQQAENLKASVQTPKLHPVDSPGQAWNLSCQNLKANDLICVTGSVFLIAELRKAIVSERPGTSIVVDSSQPPRPVKQ